MRMDENQGEKRGPGTEPRHNEKDRLAADLDVVSRRCQDLRNAMQQQLFHTSTEGNRRLMPSVTEARRQGERREPHRAGPGRRQLSDRRMPSEERLSMLVSQMMQVLDQNIALTDQRRFFEGREL